MLHAPIHVYSHLSGCHSLSVDLGVTALRARAWPLQSDSEELASSVLQSGTLACTART